MNYITLNNGVKIPQIGLGVFRTPDGADTRPVGQDAQRGKSPAG